MKKKRQKKKETVISRVTKESRDIIKQISLQKGETMVRTWDKAVGLLLRNWPDKYEDYTKREDIQL